jgi:hypothetical protein
MDHVDIEVSEGSILIFTDEGSMEEMSVEPGANGAIKFMSSRPPSNVSVGGADGEGERELVEALRRMGHDASAKEPIETIPPSLR